MRMALPAFVMQSTRTIWMTWTTRTYISLMWRFKNIMMITTQSTVASGMLRFVYLPVSLSVRLYVCLYAFSNFYMSRAFCPSFPSFFSQIFFTFVISLLSIKLSPPYLFHLLLLIHHFSILFFHLFSFSCLIYQFFLSTPYSFISYSTLLPFYISISIFISLFISFTLSISVSFTLSISLSFTLSIFISIFISISVTLSIFICNTYVIFLFISFLVTLSYPPFSLLAEPPVVSRSYLRTRG